MPAPDRTEGSLAEVSAPRTRRPVARHRVRDAIHQMILTRPHRPGQKLVQQRIATELKVSRGVVREALLELNAFGVVETIDNRGAVVRRVNRERLIESYEVRELLEGLAARHCCRRMTINDLRQLREIAEQIYQLQLSGQTKEAARLDNQFHHRLIEISGHKLLLHMTHAYWVLGKIVTSEKFDPAQTRANHLAVLAAIESGDEDQAERVLRETIRSGRKFFEELLDRDESSAIEWVL
jgi:DNA-binding GntR family transcriptional regulator